MIIAQEPKLENPIARIGRRTFSPSTLTEHPFKQDELKRIFREVLDKVHVEYFMVLSPLCYTFAMIPYLRNKKLRDNMFIVLNKIDGVLFKGEFLKKYAFLEIIHGIKRSDS